MQITLTLDEKEKETELGKELIAFMKNFATKSNVSAEIKAPAKISDKKIRETLAQIGVPANLSGYTYIIESLSEISRNRTIINHVTKELYPTVAKNLDTTPSRVERGIRNAIAVCTTRGDWDIHNKIFGFTTKKTSGKPSNSLFLAALYEYLIKNN